MYFPEKNVLFTYLMHEALKIHFCQFFRKHEIGNHMQITQNYGYDSEDRKFRMSTRDVV